MAKKKVQEDERLIAVNDSIKYYGGCYANWRSSGCKAPMPDELLERLIKLSESLDGYLKTYLVKGID